MSIRRPAAAELESLSDGTVRSSHAMSRTMVTLLTVSLVLQTLIGIGILTGILVGAYWLSSAIENININAFAEIIAHLLAASVSLDALSHEARHVAAGVLTAVNESAVALGSLNRVLRNPTMAITLPGLGTGA
jgi:hypothetical protein